MEVVYSSNERLDKQWREEFNKLVAPLTGSRADDRWVLRTVDRLPSDAPALEAAPAGDVTHSAHSIDSSSEEASIDEQNDSTITDNEKLPASGELSPDYDDVELLHENPIEIEIETKKEHIDEERFIENDEIEKSGDVLEENLPSISADIEIPVAITPDTTELINSGNLEREFQNENGIDVQIVAAQSICDIPQEINAENPPEQVLEIPEQSTETCPRDVTTAEVSAEVSAEDLVDIPVDIPESTESPVVKEEIMVTLNGVESEILIKTEKLYDALDCYVQSSNEEWIRIEPESLEVTGIVDLNLNGKLDGGDFNGCDAETSTESFHFVSASEGELQQNAAHDETKAEMEDNELPTDGGKEDANKSKSNKNLNDVEINDSSWRLERKKLIISRKGSMGHFLGRIMHSKRFHADRLPTSSATVSSSGEQDPPKRPPRRKTLANLDLSREELNSSAVSRTLDHSERSATLTSMDRRRKGSMSRLIGRVLPSKHLNTSEVSPEDPVHPEGHPSSASVSPLALPPATALAVPKKDSFGDFLRRIIPIRSKQPTEESRIEALAQEESMPVQVVPLRPDGWTEPLVKRGKVQFQCQTCKNKWSSARGIAAFCFQMAENEESGARYGEVIVRFYGQQCYHCSTRVYEKAEWKAEEVRAVLSDLCVEMGKQFYSNESEWKRFKSTQKAHNKSLCQACDEGVCKQNGR